MQILKKEKGFTLIEMLLVMVIISIIIFAGINYLQQETLATRQDKASLQMQQILNAALSYYVANGVWPSSVACLQGSGTVGCKQAYLPSTLKSPWDTDYSFTAPKAIGGATPIGYVYTSIVSAAGSTTGSAAASANVIAGKLPLSYTTSKSGTLPNPPPPPSSGGSDCTSTSTTCYVVASANIPGQNLNNAPGVNFAGVYHHGGCVPVPSCPVDANGNTMIPQIMVVPVSVSGVNTTGQPGQPNPLYPLTSFTAYAIGPAAAGSGKLNPCNNGTKVNCQPNGAATAFWRVCVDVETVRGNVALTRSNAWGIDASIAAFTRCSIKGESYGSALNVFSK